MSERPPAISPPDEHPVGRNVQSIAKLEREVINRQTRVDRVAARIARVAGSPVLIAIHIVWFAIWVGLNSTRTKFDVYPFSLLNLIVALEAIFLTSVVLMTQNRMAHLAERRAHIDLQVNLLAEQELTAMLHMLHGLCANAGVSVSIEDEHVAQLLKDTDVRKIAVTLDREHSSESEEL